MLTLLIPLLASLAITVSAENWALLVAGSNEYYNYRHQADVCHAYQILHRNGIPDERIVMMMYDDIATNEENPFQGQIINQPNGSDVYKGVVKDYTGKDVTPENFLKVLQGEKVDFGSKKVIKSGPNDNVFVFFSDHGAPGLIAFPDGSALKASQLNNAIRNMHSHKKYKNLVIYVEACESGSMFQQLLPKNINVYATTAANTQESSYACYYDEERQTYLGDLYSVNWMEDSDRNKENETLYDQFEIVKKLTNESHVLEFGNLTMGKQFFISEFQSGPNRDGFIEPLFNPRKNLRKVDSVKAEDVRHSILHKKLERAEDSSRKEGILREIEKINNLKEIAQGTIREIASVVMKNDRRGINQMIVGKSELTNFECYEPVIDYLIEKCFTFKACTPPLDEIHEYKNETYLNDCKIL